MLPFREFGKRNLTGSECRTYNTAIDVKSSFTYTDFHRIEETKVPHIHRPRRVLRRETPFDGKTDTVPIDPDPLDFVFEGESLFGQMVSFVVQDERGGKRYISIALLATELKPNRDRSAMRFVKWIHDHWEGYAAFGWQNFQKMGRGIITSTLDAYDAIEETGYWSGAFFGIGVRADAYGDVDGMVRSYAPRSEFLVSLVFPDVIVIALCAAESTEDEPCHVALQTPDVEIFGPDQVS